MKVQLIPEKEFFNAALIQRRTGVRLQELTAQLARYFHLDSTRGFIIADVDSGSAAAQELQAGSVVGAIEGQTPDDIVGAAKLVFAKKPGETVQFTVLQPRQQGRFTFLVPTAVQLTVK